MTFVECAQYQQIVVVVVVDYERTRTIIYIYLAERTTGVYSCHSDGVRSPSAVGTDLLRRCDVCLEKSQFENIQSFRNGGTSGKRVSFDIHVFIFYVRYLKEL